MVKVVHFIYFCKVFGDQEACSNILLVKNIRRSELVKLGRETLFLNISPAYHVTIQYVAMDIVILFHRSLDPIVLFFVYEMVLAKVLVDCVYHIVEDLLFLLARCVISGQFYKRGNSFAIGSFLEHTVNHCL